MPSTSTVLRTTQTIVNYYGLNDPGHPHFADLDGHLDLTAAVFRAVTGKTPNAFLTDADLSLLLITTNEQVMDAIEQISAVLPTDAPQDPDTGLDDHVEHLATWLDTVDFFLGRKPGVADVIGVLDRAARAADTLATSRTAA
jgi:hypothetical protein